jgi:hypothetical protein
VIPNTPFTCSASGSSEEIPLAKVVFLPRYVFSGGGEGDSNKFRMEKLRTGKAGFDDSLSLGKLRAA